jgi:alkylated DNA repair dioxygenase AlkB
MDLFSNEIVDEYIFLNDKVSFFPHFIDMNESMDLYASLLNKVDWRQDKIKIFGKTHLTPRLTAWYGSREYRYSGVINSPKEPLEEIVIIQQRIKEVLKEFNPNGVLLNYYRDGKDKMGWHSDDEKELGENPLIVSVSLGETRRFDLKHKVLKNEKLSLNLNSGSLLIMKEGLQSQWKHQIPAQLKVVKGRINLTFRMVR